MSIDTAVLQLRDHARFSYYRNEGVTRVCFSLNPQCHVVVKGFEGPEVRTAKIWQGSLDSVASHWTTTKFHPGPNEARALRRLFISTIQKLAPAVSWVNAIAGAAKQRLMEV